MTFDTFEPELIRLLYPGTLKPYFVYKWEREGQASVIRHYPPATRVNLPAPSTAPHAIGFRGLMVQDYEQPLSEQGLVRLSWVGLDIDAEDNPQVCQELRLGSLADYVQSLLCASPAVVRCSKSGQGAHVIIPLSETEMMTYDRAKVVSKRIAQKFIDRLKDEHIECCVTGLPNLWLYTQGGKQRTLTVPHELYHPSPQELDFSGVVPNGVTRLEPVGATKFTGLAARVIGALTADGIIPPDLPGKTQVNVGRVRRSLSRIGIEFETKSKCRIEHEGETNGWVELQSDGSVRLISNPDDNKVVLTMVST